MHRQLLLLGWSVLTKIHLENLVEINHRVSLITFYNFHINDRLDLKVAIMFINTCG